MKFISALALLSAAVLATETNTEVQTETKTETLLLQLLNKFVPVLADVATPRIHVSYRLRVRVHGVRVHTVILAITAWYCLW